MGDQAKAKVDLTEDRLFSLGLNRWVISTPEQRDDDFNGVNHLPCPDDCNRTHWLVNC